MINTTLLSVSLAAMLYGVLTHDLNALTIGAAIGLTLNTLYKRSLSGEPVRKPIEHDRVMHGYIDSNSDS